jgi:2,4-dienoyl-CoA reductase-like NADH-dependent reductase (Old Yellow Enzyme family)
MSILFSPLTIKNITLKNRLMVSPMCQYSSQDGFSNDWHLVHLGSRAVGGAAIVFTEATAVSPEGRISPGDLGIYKDEHITGLKRITEFIHQQGSYAGIQLAHAGRKASCASPWFGGKQLKETEDGWIPVAPSSLPFLHEDVNPTQLDTKGLEKVKADFKTAARRALEAGFNIIEIHSAHGYLLHEFLSPISNHRTDQYGGVFVNRIRLLNEVIDEIKTVWPSENPLFVRISATDWSDGGWTLEETVRLAFILKEKGVDLVDCSSGGNVPSAKINIGPGYQVPFAEAVRKTGIMTGAVGMITSVEQAEAILEEGKADLIIMAREFLRNPYFPLRAAQQLGVETKWPIQYERAKVFR